jgi:CRP-like cAMP-binding protein
MDKARLDTLSYFEEMSSEEVGIVAASMREGAWSDGMTILQQGDQGGGVYFVLEGTVQIEHRLEEGEVVQVGSIKPGGVFGLLGVIGASPRAASCVSQGHVRCAVMERGDFMDLLQGGTTLAMRFQLSILRCLARDIRSTNTRLAELVAYPTCRVSFGDLIEVFPDTEEVG